MSTLTPFLHPTRDLAINDSSSRNQKPTSDQDCIVDACHHSCRIGLIRRIISDIGVPVDIVLVADRISLQEAAERRRVVAGAVIVQARLGIITPAGVAIRDIIIPPADLATRHAVAVGIVGVGALNHGTCTTRHRDDVADPVRMEEGLRAVRGHHRNRLIDTRPGHEAAHQNWKKREETGSE